METKKRTTRKMDLLTAVEQVVELSRKSHLNDEFFKNAARPLKFIADKLELTKEQSLMMALFIDNSEDSCIRMSQFANHFECTTTRMLRFTKDVDDLVKRGFVYSSRERRSVSYRVPFDVIEAFKKNEKYTPRVYTGLSCMELFAIIAEVMEMRDDNEINTETAVTMLHSLLENNMHLAFVQKLKSFKLYETDEILLVIFSHLFVNNNDDHIGFHDLDFFFDHKIEWNWIKSSLTDNSNTLLETKMIEYNNDDGFVNNESFRMTWKAKEELFPELKLASMNKEDNRKNVIKHEEIVAKQLYYDKEVTSQIEDLCQLLKESHYQDICSRLEAKGYRTGFTCLFYGAPGTGKTETVLQLARQTGRDIMQVNISQIKSMWVGESEKNIKEVFDTYRNKVEKASIAPILLFNEADAIIGKRQEGAERAVDKMENSIQNIILQEMETLDGILIATTNLAQNMDKAFERRFLYKIKFEKPTVEARLHMWHEMIPSLDQEQCRILATRHEFSGGQIENIARHYAISNILHGDSTNVIEDITAYCDSECIETRENCRVGFC